MDKCTDNNADSRLSQYPASRQEQIAGLLEKGVFRIVTPEKILSNTQVFDPCLVDEIKDPCTDKAYDKSRPVMQAHNNEKENLVLTQLPIIQRAYIQLTSDFNWDFYIRLPPEQISLLDILSDYIVKVIKLLHNVSEASINRFAIYYLYYKEKSGMIESVYNPFLFWSLPKLLSLPNASFNCVVKFAIYHPHYKEKIVSNPTQTFVCVTDYFYFSYG